MKACVLAYLALSLSICLLLTAANPVAAEIVLRVAYEDKTQFPFYMGNTQQVLEKPGAAVELVKLLEEKIPGLRVELSRFPWKRCLAMLEAWRVDAIFNASFNKDRLRIGEYPWKDGAVDPSRRLTTISYHLYARSDAPIAWDGKAFADKNVEIGAPLGYSIIADLEGLGVSVVKVRSSKQSLRLLMAGRVDSVALQSVTGDFLLANQAVGLAGIGRVEPPLKTKPYYLMLSRQFKAGNQDLSERIWTAVAELREEKLDGIAKPYLGGMWNKRMPEAGASGYPLFHD
jgi:polar amino acid transport system substrate-binding protein